MNKWSMLRSTRPKLAKATALVMDFDGVHTDNFAYLSETGQETVRVSRSDGLGIELLQQLDLELLILSGERNSVVARRAEKFNVEVIHGVQDKKTKLMDWLSIKKLRPENCIYVGNDVNDLGCFEVVGLSVAVSDSHPSVLERANLVLQKKGGDGAIREIADLLIKSKNFRSL